MPGKKGMRKETVRNRIPQWKSDLTGIFEKQVNTHSKPSFFKILFMFDLTDIMTYPLMTVLDFLLTQCLEQNNLYHIFHEYSILDKKPIFEFLGNKSGNTDILRKHYKTFCHTRMTEGFCF